YQPFVNYRPPVRHEHMVEQGHGGREKNEQSRAQAGRPYGVAAATAAVREPNRQEHSGQKDDLAIANRIEPGAAQEHQCEIQRDRGQRDPEREKFRGVQKTFGDHPETFRHKTEYLLTRAGQPASGSLEGRIPRSVTPSQEVKPGMPLPLVDGNHAVDCPPLRRPYETVVSHTDGMQRPVQFSLPEIQEILQFRKVRSKIIFLPDVELKQARMVGKVVMYLCRGQAIARHLQAELPAYRGGHFSSPPRLLPHM